jgi:hypothetical protein
LQASQAFLPDGDVFRVAVAIKQHDAAKLCRFRRLLNAQMPYHTRPFGAGALLLMDNIAADVFG